MDTTYSYWIDEKNVIIRVNGPWLRFARENCAPELTEETVVGKSIWHFVAGNETQELYGLIFDKVRAMDTPVIVPFRCDSAEKRRYMRLVVSHVLNGEIQLDGVLVRQEIRPPVALFGREAVGTGDLVELCSFCRRVFVPDDDWLDAEDAIVRLGLLEESERSQIEYSACPGCAARILHRLEHGDAA